MKQLQQTRVKFATFTLIAVQSAASGTTASVSYAAKQNALDELSLDELLELRESILEAKHNLSQHH